VVEAEGRADGGSGQGQRGQSRCQGKELMMRKRPTCIGARNEEEIMKEEDRRRSSRGG
jgi:hypothetical protein